jgi:hypothetical protein
MLVSNGEATAILKKGNVWTDHHSDGELTDFELELISGGIRSDDRS